ncbi:MAG: hypothetical protein AB2704_01580 [Candidatus Thiodiazotropha taylori]
MNSSKAILYIILIVSLLTTMQCANAQYGVIQYPDSHCHALYYDENLYIGSNLAKNYTQYNTVRKANLLCTGENLVIDTPIFTNGGELVIIANTIEINAPIDTGLYLDYTDFDPFMDKQDAERLLGTQGKPQYMKLTETKKFKSYGGRVHNPLTPNLFNSYYSRGLDCERRNQRIYRPQLLPGLTSHATSLDIKISEGNHGHAPPTEEINWDSAKSGNVYFFASKIDLKQSTKLHSSCTGLRQNRVAINVSGSTGGYGGAGSLNSCTGHSTGMFDCLDEHYLLRGGINGRPQKGAEAGSVFFYITKNVEIDTSLINTNGGLPGSNKKMRSPAGKGPNGIKTGSMSDFLLESSPWPSAEKGRNGNIRLSNSLSSSKVLLEFTNRLRELELENVYLFDELAERASKNDFISALTFGDSFKNYLSDTVSHIQVSYIERLLERTSGQSRRYTSIIPEIFRDLDVSELAVGLFFSEEYRLLSELTMFELQANLDVVESYLIQTGGLVNIYNEAVFDSLLSRAVSIETADVGRTLELTRRDIQTIILLSNKLLISSERKRVESSINAINQAITAAQEKASSESDLFRRLQNFAKSVGSLSSAISSSNYINIGKALNDTIRAGKDLMRQYSESDNIDELKAELAAVKRSYMDFLAVASIVQQEALSDRATAMRFALQNRSVVNNSKKFVSVSFHDLVRLALLSYASDFSSNVLTLQNNLIALKGVLQGFPELGAGFRLKNHLNRCQGDLKINKNCTTITGSVSWKVAKINSSGDVLNALPLIVKSPRYDSISINNYGYNVVESILPTMKIHQVGIPPIIGNYPLIDSSTSNNAGEGTIEWETNKSTD